jgi:hypothetical protein
MLRMPQKRFSLVTVLQFGLYSLEAIQSLHEAGFVHRDIKPVCEYFLRNLFCYEEQFSGWSRFRM